MIDSSLSSRRTINCSESTESVNHIINFDSSLISYLLPTNHHQSPAVTDRPTVPQGVEGRIREVVAEIAEASRRKKLAAAAATGKPPAAARVAQLAFSDDEWDPTLEVSYCSLPQPHPPPPPFPGALMR